MQCREFLDVCMITQNIQYTETMKVLLVYFSPEPLFTIGCCGLRYAFSFALGCNICSHHGRSSVIH